MTSTRLFKNGNSQAVRIPAELAFPSNDMELVIERVGAYNITQSMQFITYRPNIILIDQEGKTHIIRNKESLQTFKDIEVNPKRKS